MTAQASEAAGLLRSGAIYTRRLGLVRPSDELVFAGFKPGAFSLYFGDEPIAHFDLEGRWQRAFLGGTHFLKALDTTTQAMERVREGGSLVLRRRTLSFAEATDLDAAIRSLALEVLAGLGPWRREDQPATVRPIAEDELREFLERIAAWDAAAWFSHRERYVAACGPPSFVPPDAVGAVSLRARAGGSVPEFEGHARQVAAVWGRRLVQSKSLHLGPGDTWHRPLGEIAALLGAIAPVFPLARDAERRSHPDPSDAWHRFDGVFGFLDDFGPPLPDGEGWVSLHERSLIGMTLGLISGDPEVRRFYGKTWTDQEFRATDADLRWASIGSHCVVWVGAGGAENAASHLGATVELLSSLPWQSLGIIYLFDADEVEGPSARDRLRESGLTPVLGPAFEEQLALFRQRLAPLRETRGAKVVPYSLRKQGL